MATGTESRPALSRRETETLRALVDTIVPPNSGPRGSATLHREGGASREVDIEIQRLWADYFPVSQRAAFRQFLHVVESPGLNLLLSGRPLRFSGLSSEPREAYLRGWSRSGLGAKRRGFQSIKRLATFLYYARPDPTGLNPVWPDIGYAAPSPPAVGVSAANVTTPAGLVAPDDTGPFECDVCVIGSGAGGAVVAARLAKAGHRVLIVESG
ncbi:MAG TPA: NAD(P)-binding protein, partial [Thermoplasmata archaeon]|nr:NAD(P)-binding protein [Thermoplasmata archaeon]